MPPLRYLSLAFFILFSSSAAAELEPTLKQLAQHETWLKLLKYEPDSFRNTGYLSAIHSDRFFLSESGRDNPILELEATIDAFQQTAEHADANTLAQCRFPGRFIWLQNQLGGEAALKQVSSCPDFDQWRHNGATDSISVIFASGYLGNPASFYGHTLLKMNSSSQRKRVSIEDVSINYGAIVPDGENPVSYIVKGIFGGYDAGFSHVEYYFHTHNYGENELRDLWEYELDLTQAEVDFVLAHAWEVLGQKYTYYFFRHNCTYRMAELLEIIPGIKIIPDNPMFVMPQVLMQEIAEHGKKGRELLRGIKLNASRQEQLYAAFSELSEQERRLLARLASKQVNLHDPQFSELEASSRTKVVEALMHYYLFLKESYDDDLVIQDIEAQYRKVLQARFALPVGKAVDLQQSKKPPHTGRSPSYVSVGLANISGGNDSIFTRFRPAYYDELDASDAHVAFSKLSMAEIALLTDSSGTYIEQLDFVAISSINSNATGLPGDDQGYWSMAFGLRSQNRECRNCAKAYIEGAWGQSFRLSETGRISIGLLGGLQDQSLGYGNVYAGGQARLLMHFGGGISSSVNWQSRYYLDGAISNEDVYNVELRYRLGLNSDIRLNYAKHQGELASISFGFYF